MFFPNTLQTASQTQRHESPTYLAERFPTEVRATAGGFCYHQGAIFGGLTAPILNFFAVNMHLGFAIPMLIGTIAGCHRGAALQSGNSREGIGAGRRAGLSRRYPDRADAKAVAELRRCGEPRLLTTEPSPDVAPIHYRQMERSDWSAWLEQTGNEASLLRALAAGSLKVEQVR